MDKITCNGAYAIGTACGKCERCADRRGLMFAERQGGRAPNLPDLKALRDHLQTMEANTHHAETLSWAIQQIESARADA